MLRTHCLLNRTFLYLFAFSTLAAAALAQNDKPHALMRYRGTLTTIETIVPAKQKAGTKISLAIYKSVKKVANAVAKSLDVQDCSGALIQGAICKQATSTGRILIAYTFNSPADEPDKYSVAYSLTDDAAGEIDQMLPVSTDFDEIKPEIVPFVAEDEFYTKAGFGTLNSKPNGVLKLTINFPDREKPPSKEYDEYIEERIDRIYDWLEKQAATPESLAAIRVEPRTKEIPKNVPLDFHVYGFAYDPYPRSDDKQSRPRRINIFLVTKESLPKEDFDIEITFQNSPDYLSGHDPRWKVPEELASAIKQTMSAVSSVTAPDASDIGGNKKLELREMKSNLDAAVAFTSSVENKEENGVTTRKRSNDFALDLLFAPVLNKALDTDEVHLFTPFFIDAKVSNGKITEKTLSLNRILLGTQYAIRYRPNRRDKYIFTFSGINASDRDFKRAEAKFNFEFRPIWRAWNRPLDRRFLDPAPASILIPDNGPKSILTGNFGFQIQPMIGFEVGRIYREKRAAFDVEENSRNLRRLLLGLDLGFNITRLTNITITDTFYTRGESSDARFRNYFKGELDIPIVLTNRTAQSVFFSFEKGDQPPFVSPGVNSLKIGYRIVSSSW